MPGLLPACCPSELMNTGMIVTFAAENLPE
jgi:hypothetical protein